MVVVFGTSVYASETDSLSELAKLSINELFDFGEREFVLKNYDSALVYYNLIASRPTHNMSRDEMRMLAVSLNHAGNINYKKMAYTHSMNNYLAGLKICDTQNFEFEKAQIYVNMGNLYSSNKDYETSIEFYCKALPYLEANSNLRLYASTLNNLVCANAILGNVAKAKEFYALLADCGDSSLRYRFDLKMDLALINNSAKDYATAKKNYLEALEFAKSNNLDVSCIGSVYLNLASIYKAENKSDSAIIVLKTCESEARKYARNDLLIEVLRSLASIYEQTNRNDVAMVYKSECFELSDSIFNKAEYGKIKDAGYLYELDKKVGEINSLSTEITVKDELLDVQRRWLLVVGVLLAVILVVSVLLLRDRKRLKIANNNLFDRIQEQLNKDLKDAKEKRNMFVMSDEQRSKLLADILHVMDDTEEFFNPDFGIETLARLIDSNSKYVSFIINNDLKKKFRDFLNEYRIKKAMIRIGDVESYGNYTIKAIAESVGYVSQSNFIREFTKHVGIKPSTYRKIAIERQSS